MSDRSTAVDKEPKLVKISDLPLHGNPYPPKDVIENETPGKLELAVRSVRTTLQPYMSPICTVYQTGAAHTRSALVNLRENPQLTNILIVSSSGILGIVLARRKGFVKQLLYGSVFSGGAAAACASKRYW
jgi:hypothetical protein